jgi:mannosyltransferase
MAIAPPREETLYAPGPAARLERLSQWRYAVPAGLLALVVLSALLRTQRMSVGFWIDEGLSVGISDRSLLDIPGVLRQDGSPPLYYLVLHLWMKVAGRGEEATHALSLLFALACIPLAFFAARSLFTDERTAWFAALLAAANPFLTRYAQETRMYSLVVLLAIGACWAFGHTYLAGRPRPVLFGVLVAALMYTHNWALFLAAALGVAWLVLLYFDRSLLRRGLIGFGTALLIYAPWMPSLLFQAQHTGAPWARKPGRDELAGATGQLLGEMPQMLLLLAGGAGIVALWQAGRRRAGVLLAVAAGTLLLAYVSSQAEPAWAVRYLAVLLAPLVLAAAAGLAAAGRLGVAALVLCLLFWADEPGPVEKSNVRDVAEALAPGLQPGDLFISTQPEQIPVSHYYLPDGLRYATLWGPLKELGVTDWRDGVQRLEGVSADRDLEPLMDALPAGRRLVVLEPVVYDSGRWSAPWTRLVRNRSKEWIAALRDDARFRVTAIYPPSPFPAHPNPVKATVFVKSGMR